MAKIYWLLKNVPSGDPIDYLTAEPDQPPCWRGVRNFQARFTKLLRKEEVNAE